MNLPDPGTDPGPPALQADSLLTEPTGNLWMGAGLELGTGLGRGGPYPGGEEEGHRASMEPGTEPQPLRAPMHVMSGFEAASGRSRAAWTLPEVLRSAPHWVYSCYLQTLPSPRDLCTSGNPRLHPRGGPPAPETLRLLVGEKRRFGARGQVPHAPLHVGGLGGQAVLRSHLGSLNLEEWAPDPDLPHGLTPW